MNYPNQYVYSYYTFYNYYVFAWEPFYSVSYINKCLFLFLLAACGDTINNCANYGAGVCQTPAIAIATWAHSNCAGTCGFCSGECGFITNDAWYWSIISFLHFCKNLLLSLLGFCIFAKTYCYRYVYSSFFFLSLFLFAEFVHGLQHSNIITSLWNFITYHMTS
jgi:hypothetical protein